MLGEAVLSLERYDAEAGRAGALPAADGGASPVQEALPIDRMHFIGDVFGSYLLATDADSFYLVDQHAAHERVNYERFMQSVCGTDDPPRQALLSPHVCHLSAQQRLYMEDGVSLLCKLGFDAEPFGESSVAIRAFPSFLTPGEAERFALDVLENGGKAGTSDSHARERVIAGACRRAVKAGERLSPQEAEALLQTLSACANPYTCPHGRPIFVRFTKYELERLFQRA